MAPPPLRAPQPVSQQPRTGGRRDQPGEGKGSALRSLTTSTLSPFLFLLFSLACLSSVQAVAQARRLGTEERRVGAPTEGSAGGGRCGGRSQLQLCGRQSHPQLQPDSYPFQHPTVDADRSLHLFSGRTAGRLLWSDYAADGAAAVRARPGRHKGQTRLAYSAHMSRAGEQRWTMFLTLAA